MLPTTLYFDVPGAVDLAAKPLLPLTRTAPTALGVADADGDGRTGNHARALGQRDLVQTCAPTDATIRGGRRA